MLLVVTRDEKLDLVWAMDGADAKYPVLAGKALKLTAIELSCSLDTLGLQPGAQELTAPTMSEPKLPAPKAVYESSIQGADQTPWAPTNGLGEAASLALRSLNLKEDYLCDLYSIPLEARDASAHGTATSSTPSFGLPLSDGTVFVGTLTGEFFRVSEDVAPPETPPTQLTELSTTTPHHAGFIRDDGEIFLLGADGRFARGDLMHGFVEQQEQALGGASQHVRLSGSKSGPVELFAVSDAKAFQRFDGLRWTTLSTSAAEPRDDNIRSVERPGVVWLGPNEAMATLMVTHEPTVILHYKNGEVRRELSPFTNEIEHPSEVLDVPGWGVIVGSDNGRISFRKGDAWGEPIRISNARVRAMVSLGPSLLVYSLFGFEGTEFVQYQRSAGACRARQPYTSGFIRHMIPLGERSVLLLIVTRELGHDLVQMTVLEKTADIPACLEVASGP